MIEAPLAWAFTAGLVATVNPCGFAMLPAYLSYFVGSETADRMPARSDPRASIGRALVTGGVVSAGFLVVFGVVGALVTFGLRSVIDAVPWLALGIGAALFGLGIAMLVGFHPSLALPQVRLAGRERRLRFMFGFGVAYAVASLSCTLPVFLAVVAGTLTSTNFASGLASFLAYGAGMSLVLLALTIAIALARTTLVDRVRGVRRYVEPASGVLLVLAGGYVVYYWALALSTEPGRGFTGPASEVEQISGRISRFLTDNPSVVGIVLAAVVLAAVAVILAATPRRRERSPLGASCERCLAGTSSDELEDLASHHARRRAARADENGG